MPENVTMHVPNARIIRVKRDGNASSWRHKDGVAESAFQRFAADLDHLKRVTVQMHRVRHRGFIDEVQRDSLTLLYIYLWLLSARLLYIKDNAVDRPIIAGHLACQPQIETLINWLRGKWVGGDQLALQIQSQQSCRGRIFHGQLLDRRAQRRQDDPGLLGGVFS